MSDEGKKIEIAPGVTLMWTPEMATQLEAKQRLQATCDHAGYSFKKMGRCCFTCGIFMVDWGD